MQICDEMMMVVIIIVIVNIFIVKLYTGNVKPQHEKTTVAF